MGSITVEIRETPVGFNYSISYDGCTLEHQLNDVDTFNNFLNDLCDKAYPNHKIFVISPEKVDFANRKYTKHSWKWPFGKYNLILIPIR